MADVIRLSKITITGVSDPRRLMLSIKRIAATSSPVRRDNPEHFYRHERFG